MSDFRAIIRSYVEHQVIQEYYGANYFKVPPGQIIRTLEFLRSKGYIDQEIERIIDGFIIQVNKTKSRQRKKYNISYVVLNLVITPLISYAVNIENWVFVCGLSLISLVAAILFIILSDQ